MHELSLMEEVRRQALAAATAEGAERIHATAVLQEVVAVEDPRVALPELQPPLTLIQEGGPVVMASQRLGPQVSPREAGDQV